MTLSLTTRAKLGPNNGLSFDQFYYLKPSLLRSRLLPIFIRTFILECSLDCRNGHQQYQGGLSVRVLEPALTRSPSDPQPLSSFRPQNAIETRENGEIIVSFDDSLTTCQLRSAALSTGPERDGFTFDRVFPMGTKQQEVFDYGVKEYACPVCSLSVC